MGKELNLLDFLIVLLKHKWLVFINFVIISIIAFIIAFSLTKYYKSEVVFIPKGRAGSGLFSIIGDNLSADIIGGSSLSKRQFKAVLYSRELREKLIKKFNLVEVYKNNKKPNPIDKTLKYLENYIKIDEEQEGGLGITDVISLTITVIDKDPVRASDMANYLFSLLEEKAMELNQEEYKKITAFFLSKINHCNSKLGSARKELNVFQLANHAYDIPQQVSMVLQAGATIKAEILSLENKIIYIKSIHSNNYDEIPVLKQKKAALEKKLSEIENSKKNDIFLGLTQSLNLSNTYTDLYTEVQTYNQLRLLLKQQLEQANIKKSKDFVSLYLIDAARPAEYKFKPKRSLVILGIVFCYMFILITFLILWNHYQNLRYNNPDKLKKIDLLLQYVKLK